jgi:mannose-6-phosphate isomerase-like protein (cupin superfamily)
MARRQPDTFPLLADLVGDPVRFSTLQWGSTPLHVHRPAGVAMPHLSLADVETMLDSSIRPPSIRLVRDGRPCPSSEWTRRTKLGGVEVEVADGPATVAAFGAGASIVLQGLQRTWPPLARFAQAFEREISHPVQVNAYVTPPHERGLGRHADSHDVFVVQTHGTKAWSVDGLGEVHLVPGEVLYVPAGTPHHAASRDGVSAHLTIGVLRRTVRHLLEGALRNMPTLDQPLALGFARTDADSISADIDDVVRSASAELLDRLADGRLARAALDRARPPTTIAEQLHAVDRATTIAIDTCIRWRPETTLDRTTRPARVIGEGRWLEVPDVAVPAVIALRDAVHLSVAELPGLDDDSRLVIARRLVRERFADVFHDHTDPR